MKIGTESVFFCKDCNEDHTYQLIGRYTDYNVWITSGVHGLIDTECCVVQRHCGEVVGTTSNSSYRGVDID